MKTKKKTVNLAEMTREELEKNYIELLSESEARIIELESENDRLLSMLRKQRAEKFGPSSEKTHYDSDQISFFDEAEKEASETEEEISAPDPAFNTVGASKKPKKKAKRTKQALYGNIPCEEIVCELSEAEQVCPVCGSALRKMKVTRREELVLIPARVVRRKYVQQHYVCDECQKTGDGNPVVSAPTPRALFEGGGWASPSFVAETIVRKYDEYVPLYRQERIYADQGLRISRQTMANQLLRTREIYLHPIYDIMHDMLITQDFIHADETECEVLCEPGRRAAQKSWIWLFRTPAGAERTIILYKYSDSRSTDVPEDFLRKKFSGYLQSDAYAAYRSLADKSPRDNKIISVACLAHIRRKWTDAVKGLPDNKKNDPTTNIAKGLSYCNQMFDVEKTIQKLPSEKIQSAREEKLKPLMTEYFAWAEKLFPETGKSYLQDALKYSINQKEYMMNVLLDPRLVLTNSIAERSIKPFVMGRKNFLFFRTPRGADASAEIYSIVETAKENGLNPFRYIEHVLETLAQIKDPVKADYEKLLPWSEDLPEKCKAGYLETRTSED